MHTIKNEYPDFGGDYEIIHHSEFIQELFENGHLSSKTQYDKTVTFHDPCYLGRHNKKYNEPRNVLENVLDIDKIMEMKENKESSMCCGAGGGNMWHEINEGDRINVARFNQALDTNAEVVATACSFCTIMMDDAMKVTGKENEVEIQDIAEIVGNSIE